MSAAGERNGSVADGQHVIRIIDLPGDPDEIMGTEVVLAIGWSNDGDVDDGTGLVSLCFGEKGHTTRQYMLREDYLAELLAEAKTEALAEADGAA